MAQEQKDKPLEKLLLDRAFRQGNQGEGGEKKDELTEFEKRLLELKQRERLLEAVYGGGKGINISLDIAQLIKGQSEMLNSMLSRLEEMEKKAVSAEMKAEVNSIRNEIISLKERIDNIAKPQSSTSSDPFEAYKKIREMIDEAVAELERKVGIDKFRAGFDRPETIAKLLEYEDKKLERERAKYEHEKELEEIRQRYQMEREELRRQWAKEERDRERQFQIELLKLREDRELKRKALSNFEDLAQAIIASIEKERGIEAQRVESAEVVEEEKQEEKPQEKYPSLTIKECISCHRKSGIPPDTTGWICPFCWEYNT